MLGIRAGTKTKLSFNAPTRGAPSADGSARIVSIATNPIAAQAAKQTPSIRARMAGFLKMLSPPLPLLPARSWDFARITVMA